MTFPVALKILHIGYSTGFNIVILPLTVLRSNQLSKLNSLSALSQPCAITWKNLMANPALITKLMASPTLTSIQFILVTPEATEQQQFKIFFNTLLSLKRINRVVIDECHNVITSGFRSSYSNLAWMLQAPVLLLSATIPAKTKMLEQLKERLSLDQIEIFRTPVVVRKELSYAIKSLNNFSISLSRAPNGLKTSPKCFSLNFTSF